MPFYLFLYIPVVVHRWWYVPAGTYDETTGKQGRFTGRSSSGVSTVHARTRRRVVAQLVAACT